MAAPRLSKQGVRRRRHPGAWILVLAAACWLAAALPCQRVEAATFPHGSGGRNAPSQQDKASVVLLSIDGFRWSFPDLYPLPALQRVAAQGARAKWMISAWPALTFPNHYSIATGLWPARHGIVGNEFPDPARDRWYSMHDRASVEDGSFYDGEPLWVTAEQQGMVAAAYFWVGSEAEIAGVRPTHWRAYDKTVPGEARVDQALAWLAEPPATRPHLILLYFEDVDDNAHWTGLDSPEFHAALQRVDGHVGRLLDGIAALPAAQRVYLLIVSDHGQMPYSDPTPFVLNEHVDLAGLHLVDGGCYVFAWQERPDPAAAHAVADTVNQAWPHGTAYTRESAPAAWGLRDSPRFPDLVFQADAGYAVLSGPQWQDKIDPGDHGWLPETPGMHGVFLAVGPGIPAATRLGPVRVVDVAPFVLDLLGLTPPPGLDGDASALSGLLH